jgi:hypothetical protein
MTVFKILNIAFRVVWGWIGCCMILEHGGMALISTGESASLYNFKMFIASLDARDQYPTLIRLLLRCGIAAALVAMFTRYF